MLANYCIPILCHDRKCILVLVNKYDTIRSDYYFKKIAALLKDDCEDGYIMHAIDKAAKHLGYDSIKLHIHKL